MVRFATTGESAIDVVRSIAIEHTGTPRGSGLRGFPQPAGRRSEVELAGVGGESGDDRKHGRHRPPGYPEDHPCALGVERLAHANSHALPTKLIIAYSPA